MHSRSFKLALIYEQSSCDDDDDDNAVQRLTSKVARAHVIAENQYL